MIVGIAGGSCSGKTTLLTELEHRLGGDCASVSFDDYFVGTDQIEGEIADWESPKLYRYDSFIQDLTELRTGHPITLRTKSRESTKRGLTTKLVEPKRFTLIEGFLIFCDETARPLFDKRIFIELPESEIVKRRLARSEGTSHWDDPDYIKQQLIPGHRRYVEPQKAFADLVLDGMTSTKLMSDVVMDFLRH